MTNKSYASEVVHSPSREETPSIQSADTDSQTQREKTFHDNTLESSKLAPQAGTLDAKNGAQGPKGPPAGPGMGFPQVEFPTGIKLYSNIISLYLAGFLTALDRTIIVNAIPTITNQFQSINDIGWYGSAYLLTFCAFQLLFGKVYSFYNAKWVFMIAVTLFLIGSAISGAAQSSNMLIVGRAISGLGASGIFGGSVIITFFTVPLKLRPIYTGIVSMIFAVASIVGPLIGGALTQHASWRWCFFINLPIGAVTLIVTAAVLKLPAAKKAGTPLKKQLQQLDPVGNFALIPAVVSLLLALQWGGVTYAWSNWRIILLFVLGGLLGIAFVVSQLVQTDKDKVLVNPAILKQRSMACAFIFTFCVSASMMTLTYYLPIWFQAIKDASPTHAGIMMLPLVVASGIFGLGSGIAISKFVGFYTPFMMAGAAFMALGAGLLTLFTPSTSHPRWISFQFLWGLGAGLGLQQGGLVAQTVLPKMQAPVGISVIFFGQSLGGSVSLAVAQAIFQGRLRSQVMNIPDKPSVDIVDIGATDIRRAFPEKSLPALLRAYNDAVTSVFIVATVTACVAFLATLPLEWKNVRKAQQGGPTGSSGLSGPSASCGKGASEATKAGRGMTADVNNNNNVTSDADDKDHKPGENV